MSLHPLHVGGSLGDAPRKFQVRQIMPNITKAVWLRSGAFRFRSKMEMKLGHVHLPCFPLSI